MTETVFAVKTGNFEGPLEVLLGLIEKRKLFINEISLAAITDDFVNYVRTLEKKDMESYAAFISVAATLILIKSRSLIPNLALTESEEEDIGALERRLELYKLIKEIGIELSETFGKEIIFPRLPTKLETKVFAPDTQITKDSMLAGAESVLAAMPEEEKLLPEVAVMKVKSIEETINDLLGRVKDAMKMSFHSFSQSHGYATPREQKVGVVVSFLAMLELVRQGLIDAVQENDFGDIDMQKL